MQLLMEKNYGITKCYNYLSYNHCSYLHNRYLSLSEQERPTWKTESEIRLEARERMQQRGDTEYLKMLKSGDISSPDCVYTNSSGEAIAYEVVTDNYRQTQLDAKYAMCQYMNYKVETERVA